MRQFISISLVITLFTIYSAKAQSYDQLKALKDHAAQVYYSDGHEPRASSIAVRVDKAMVFYQELLQFKPAVTLLVLSAEDWEKHALKVVYGMPHYNNKTKALIVAAEDNVFWKSFLPPLDKLPQGLREQIQTVYKNGNKVSMQAFFDLLAIHELGHAFHDQAGLTMQRNWMGELFVNILLHTYIAENEPASLPALTLFPKIVVSGGTKEFKYTSLHDVHTRYNEIGQQFPKNYGWYQCRWHSAAADIYNSAGKKVSRKLWDSFKSKKEILTDDELIYLLEAADKSVADVVRNWDRDIVR